MHTPSEERLADFIRALPSHRTLLSADLLRDEVLLHRDSKISVYYAPLDHINREAKLVIAGITPGWQQVAIAYRVARDELLKGESLVEAQGAAKKAAAFAGTMRGNLIFMLEGIGLPRRLAVRSTSDLFGHASSLAHFTSVIRYPVFAHQKAKTKLFGS
jgi:hypothetical protein